MRISDWSSDVCSSDLAGRGYAPDTRAVGRGYAPDTHAPPETARLNPTHGCEPRTKSRSKSRRGRSPDLRDPSLMPVRDAHASARRSGLRPQIGRAHV